MKNWIFASGAALALLAGQAAAGGYDCGPKSHSGGFGIGLGIGLSFSGSCWKGCAPPPACPPGGCAPGYDLGVPHGAGGHDLHAMYRGYGHPGYRAVAYQQPNMPGVYPVLVAAPAYGYGYNPGAAAMAYNYGYSPYAAQPSYGAYQNGYAWGQQAPANYLSPYAAPVYTVNALSGAGR
jgi:hypothetical protein